MEHRLDLTKRALGELLVKAARVDIVRDAQAGQVAKFIALGEVVYRNHIVDATGIEPAHNVAANKAGSAGDDDAGHVNNSS